MSSARERRRMRRLEIIKADNERTAQAFAIAVVELGPAPLDAIDTAGGCEAYREKISKLAYEKFMRLN